MYRKIGHILFDVFFFSEGSFFFIDEHLCEMFVYQSVSYAKGLTIGSLTWIDSDIIQIDR